VAEKPNNSLNYSRRATVVCSGGVVELPKRHRVVVHVEDPEMSVKETLEPLDRQNKGLAPSEWIVVRGNESRDSTSAHKLPAKARKGSEDEKGGGEPTI
jgi:hypothetical protein